MLFGVLLDVKILKKVAPLHVIVKVVDVSLGRFWSLKPRAFICYFKFQVLILISFVLRRGCRYKLLLCMIVSILVGRLLYMVSILVGSFFLLLLNLLIKKV